MAATVNRFDDWLRSRLQEIPVRAVIPVSLSITFVVGGLIPWWLHFDRGLALVYVIVGAVLGMLPVVAVMAKQNLLESRRRLLVENGYVEGIGNLDYSEFEELVAAWYESQGYTAKVIGGRGDGGIDIQVSNKSERLAVQCKHWKQKQVGPREVRELRGAVGDPSVTPVLVTSGHLSEAARREAHEKGIDIVDGAELITRLDVVIAEVAPSCPQCKGDMRPKNGRFGKFWSCLRWPECRGSQDFYPL